MAGFYKLYVVGGAGAKLREDARLIFARMGIWEADLREVRQSV
jgi:hypothetical protein